ncbi:hypothetical protein [Floridanema evergladense]|uniref:Uncharacterized protein n=1 Tax=Floridaenema evergladense BLCC-F167 TaxID=3153639 RepID=A0ABV4WN92_9CYAN
MKINFNQKLTALGTVGLTIATWLLPFVPTASAEVLARAHGRCKLTEESSQYPRFDGHCIVKQKQQGSTVIFIVELDNGSQYRFFGPDRESLQVETHDELHNVRFRDEPDRGVFTWEEDGARQRLSVKLDSQYPTNVSHDNDRKPSTGEVVAGVAVGALIVGLLSGKHGSSSSNSNNSNTTQARVGASVPNLEDLVGARAGQAENTVRDRGYVWVKATQQADSAYSNWRERRTGNCVAIRTTNGRYAAIVYAPKADCDR